MGWTFEGMIHFSLNSPVCNVKKVQNIYIFTYGVYLCFGSFDINFRSIKEAWSPKLPTPPSFRLLSCARWSSLLCSAHWNIELVKRFRKFQDTVSSSIFFKSEFAPEKGPFPSLQEVWSHLNRMHPVSQERTAWSLRTKWFFQEYKCGWNNGCGICNENVSIPAAQSACHCHLPKSWQHWLTHYCSSAEWG